MSQGHIRSILPQRGGVSPVDNNTVALFHYDEHTRDSLKGIRIIGNEKTLEGIYSKTPAASARVEGLPNGAKPRTIECWFYPTSNNDIIVGAIFGYPYKLGTNYGTNRWFEVKYSDAGDNKFGFHLYATHYLSTNTFAPNQWYHLAATYDGSAVKLYVNGVLEINQAVALDTIVNDSGDNFNIFGPINNVDDMRSGKIYDVRVWNIARSQSEIQSTMHSHLLSNENGLLANWRLEEGSGTLVFDKVNGNDGLLSTEALWSEGNSIHSLTKDTPRDGGVLVEEGTTNLISSPYLTHKSNEVVGTSSISQESFSVDGKELRGLTFIQGATADIVSFSISHSKPSGATTFSAYIRSTKANPLKTQIKCRVDAVDYWLDDNGAWVTTTVENHKLLSNYTDIGSWQRVSYTIPAPPSGTTLESTSYFPGLYRATGDFTLNIANVQLEQKTFATSFVDGSRSKSLLRYANPLARNFTISFWAKTNTAESGGVNTNKCFISITDSTQDFQFFLARFSDGNLTFWGRNTGGTVGYLIDSTAPITLGDWHFITLTCVANHVKLYHNGTFVGEATNFDIDYVLGVPQMYVGSENPERTTLTQRRLFNGIIDELRIDKIARTDAEIQAWYYQGRNGW